MTIRKLKPKPTRRSPQAAGCADFDATTKPAAVANALLTIAQACGALALVVIAGLALLITSNYAFTEGVAYSERADLTTPSTSWGCASAAACVLTALVIGALLFCIWRTRLGKLSPRAMLGAVMAWALVFQLAWVFSLNGQLFVFPDTLDLTQAATALMSGDYAQFSSDSPIADKTGPDRYFTMYPFQAGSLYVFVAVFSVFGVGNFAAFQVVNAVANCLAIACLTWMAKSLSRSVRTENLATVLSGLCFPLLFSCSLVYGNSLGLLGSTAALALLAHGLLQTERTPRLVFTALSFLAITVAMLMKSTCILFLIAMVVLLLIESMRVRSASLCAITLVCALAAYGLSGLPTKALQEQTDADFGDGMPKTSWIAMGLRDDNPLGVPGWWGLYPSNLQVQTNGDASEQNSLALDSIADSLGSFATNPAAGAKFFGWKLASEWSDPTFQTLYYSSLTTLSDGTTRAYGHLANSVIYGTAHKPFMQFMDAYQALIAAGALGYCMRAVLSRKRGITNAGKGNAVNPTLAALLPASIFLGFCVYVLWEAKAIYTLPFFVLMIPLAATSLGHAFAWFEKRLYGDGTDERHP